MLLKTIIDPKLLKLQLKIPEIVSSIILENESYFYDLVRENFRDKMEYILGTTCSVIIEMITEINNQFFNKRYKELQNNESTPFVGLLQKLGKWTDYGPHILLEKLFRLTFDAHIELNREQLVLDNLDIYKKSLLTQINIYMLSKNLMHIFSKGGDDDIDFVNIPNDKNAFEIVIDKNINI